MKQSITLTDIHGGIHGLCYVPEVKQLFASVMSIPCTIVRFNTPTIDLNDYTTAALTGNQGYDIIYIPSKGKLYATCSGGSLINGIFEIDPITLQSSCVINANIHAESLCTDGRFLYFADKLFGILYQYRLSDLGLHNSIQLQDEDGFFCDSPHACKCDGNNIYLTGATSPAWIAKVNPVDLSHVVKRFQEGDNIATDDMAITSTDIWVGLEPFSGAGAILKINKETLDIQRIFTGIAKSKSVGCWYDGNRYVYNCIPSKPAYVNSPGLLEQINIIDNTIRMLNMDEGERTLNEVQGDEENLYLTCFLNPPIVMKIPKITFSTKRKFKFLV